MKTPRTPAILLMALCMGFLIFLGQSTTLLPERMACHFGGGGQADGWMSRTSDLHLIGALGVGLTLMFFILALVTRHMPARFVNLPNREHWLSPEHRAETCAYISGQLLWMGCLLILFLAGIHWLTIQANRLTPAHLPMGLFMAMLGGLLAGVGAWSFNLIHHFSK